MLQKRQAIGLIAAAMHGGGLARLFAQSAPGAPTAGATSQRLSAQQLENIVAPVALYPDDLLAILLPSATTPLEIVKAQRFLDRRKSNPNLQPDASMPAPVKSLLNYPDVVKSMSDDLDWTSALGTAVTVQQKRRRRRNPVVPAQGLRCRQSEERRQADCRGREGDDQGRAGQSASDLRAAISAGPGCRRQPGARVCLLPDPVPGVLLPVPARSGVRHGVFVGATTAYAFNWNNASINYNVNVNNLQQERMNYANNAREDWQSQSRSNQTQRQGQSRPKPDAAAGSSLGTTSANQAQRQQAATNQQTQRPQSAAQTQQTSLSGFATRPALLPRRRTIDGKGVAAEQRVGRQPFARTVVLRRGSAFGTRRRVWRNGFGRGDFPRQRARDAEPLGAPGRRPGSRRAWSGSAGPLGPTGWRPGTPTLTGNRT